MAEIYQSIEGWFDFDDIYELAIRRCGSKSARFVEIGAYKGRSTCYLAERIRETESDIRFEVVDTFAGNEDVGYRNVWPEFAANLKHAGLLSALTVHRCTSVEAALTFEDQSVDFVFIDATHSFDAVSHDLAAWWPKLRPGALIAGHDYTNSLGVRGAVDAFVAEQSLGRAFRSSRSSWMVYRSLAVNAAYCINLARRPDRRRNAEMQFDRAGISANVAFFDATDGLNLQHPGAVSSGQAGCAASHLAVIRTARERGYSNVLVFEDDVELAEGFSTRLETALARCPASYDLCYAGAICHADWGNYLYPFDDLLSRVGSIYGTHAYIVNMECYSAIEAGLGGSTNVIDDWFAKELQPRGNCYSCTPYLAFQSTGYSDVANAFNSNRSYMSYVWR